jgi:hypothetical protein
MEAESGDPMEVEVPQPMYATRKAVAAGRVAARPSLA